MASGAQLPTAQVAHIPATRSPHHAHNRLCSIRFHAGHGDASPEVKVNAPVTDISALQIKVHSGWSAEARRCGGHRQTLWAWEFIALQRRLASSPTRGSDAVRAR
ncbi:hypothetical protein ACFFWC_23475 [Plantactinospora siamensis]|uniref:Uncharacterized protein n=1 Tax=Plantactinospora siamensis TaxID=555372 RepID=A0ABV6NWG9_9ACTN